jgi:hypothetical protein
MNQFILRVSSVVLRPLCVIRSPSCVVHGASSVVRRPSSVVRDFWCSSRGGVWIPCVIISSRLQHKKEHMQSNRKYNVIGPKCKTNFFFFIFLVRIFCQMESPRFCLICFISQNKVDRGYNPWFDSWHLCGWFLALPVFVCLKCLKNIKDPQLKTLADGYVFWLWFSAGRKI